MAPTPYDGLNPWKGKKNPVTLVNTVVTRKSAVQPSNLFPASSPNATTTPDKIPTKLIATWTKVNVVMPKIMMRLLSEPADITTITTQIATRAIRGGRASPPTDEKYGFRCSRNSEKFCTTSALLGTAEESASAVRFFLTPSAHWPYCGLTKCGQ